MSDLVGPRGATVVAHVTADQSCVAEAELCAVVLADTDMLHEPERPLEPLDRLAHVRVDEDRDTVDEGMERFGFTSARYLTKAP